jgi:hypothetical protein
MAAFYEFILFSACKIMYLCQTPQNATKKGFEFIQPSDLVKRVGNPPATPRC